MRAETYREAAMERVRAAHDLYERRDYALALYCAGLAVECILRAYRVQVDHEFDARHRINVLYKQSGMAEVVPARHADRIGAAVGEIAWLWRNEHRFRSEATLRKHLSKDKRIRKWKGDVLKEATRRSVEAALEIVSRGIRAWRRSSRN